MHPNGTTQTTEAAIPRDPTDPPDQQYVPGSWQPALMDMRWIDEQYNLGAFAAYRGEWIAVVEKKVLGHGESLKKLREDVARETGFPASRIITTYIESDSDLDMFPE